MYSNDQCNVHMYYWMKDNNCDTESCYPFALPLLIYKSADICLQSLCFIKTLGELKKKTVSAIYGTFFMNTKVPFIVIWDAIVILAWCQIKWNFQWIQSLESPLTLFQCTIKKN